jgi:hypothetical protein
MLTLPEFIGFYQYIKKNFEKFDNFFKLGEYQEWIDFKLETRGENRFVNYGHVLDSEGNLIPKNSEILDKNTLMGGGWLHISEEDYLTHNHTSQGLPNKAVKSGNLYYSSETYHGNHSTIKFIFALERALEFCDPKGGVSTGVRAAVSA